MAELRAELADQEEVGRNPTAVPTQDDVRALMQAVKYPRDGVVLRLLYSTGMRASELGHLKPEALRPDEGTIFIEAGKENKDRYVMADRETFSQVAAWIARHPGRVKRFKLFGLSDLAVQVIVDGCATRSGVEQKYRARGLRVSPHSLRHAFATHCYQNGMPLGLLRMLMGHHYLATTEIYVQVCEERMREEYSVAHPLGGPREADAVRDMQPFRADALYAEDDGAELRKHPIATPTLAEVEQLLAAPTDPRDRLLLRLLYATALRSGEVANLRWCDIRGGDGAVFVRCGKMGKDRYASIDDETVRMLEARRGRAAPDGSVFDIGKGEIWKIVQGYGEMTGILRKYHEQNMSLGPHSFRHAAATHCYENGMPLESLMAMLGHGTLSITDLYVAVPESIIRRQYFQASAMES